MDYQKLLLTADGRLNRQPYWLAALAIAVCSMVVSGIGAVLNVPIIGILFSLATLVPSVMMGIKRCHDRDRTGWFLLLFLVPLLNLWPLIELLFLPGTPGPNRFGPDPLSPRVAFAA